MSTLPYITAYFVGIFAVLQVVLTMLVVRQRVKAQVSLLDGGDKPLMRLIRAHGNFTETVPMALLTMGAAELLMAPLWLLCVGGAMLLTGRLLHANVVIRKGLGPTRAIGMVLTLTPMLVFGFWVLIKSFML